jgi:hypothetical protein
LRLQSGRSNISAAIRLPACLRVPRASEAVMEAVLVSELLAVDVRELVMLAVCSVCVAGAGVNKQANNTACDGAPSVAVSSQP